MQLASIPFMGFLYHHAFNPSIKVRIIAVILFAKTGILLCALCVQDTLFSEIAEWNCSLR